MTKNNRDDSKIRELAQRLGIKEEHLLRCAIFSTDDTLILFFHAGTDEIDLNQIKTILGVPELSPVTMTQILLMAKKSSGRLGKPKILVDRGIEGYVLVPMESNDELEFKPFSLGDLLSLLSYKDS